MKKNKYETGEMDSFSNHDYNWKKVFSDLKKVVLNQKRMTKDLYEVMYMRFTIAHYDMMGWLSTYDGNWDSLAIKIIPSCYGGFPCPPKEPFDDIKEFLWIHARDEIDFKKYPCHE